LFILLLWSKPRVLSMIGKSSSTRYTTILYCHFLMGSIFEVTPWPKVAASTLGTLFTFQEKVE
jgi:hypothetical protein